MAEDVSARRTLHFGQALLANGWASDVRITVSDGLIGAIAPGETPQPLDERHAIGLPGMSNVHSHAFQRGMAGSNVLIDMTEELRWLEYGQRLAQRSRNVLASAPGRSTGQDIYAAAVEGGAGALGVSGGLAIGHSADLVSLDPKHPSLTGKSGSSIIDGFLFAGGRGVIDAVWRRGERLVSGGRHRARDRLVERYRQALAALVA